jgi:tetratricopeptide (TPR) repeat protein
MQRSAYWLVSALFGLAAVRPQAAAQQRASDSGAPCHEHGPIAYVPRDVLEKAIALRVDVGRVDDPVSTKSAEAQSFYNQGVAYLHSYVWIDAARSFNHVLRLDPDLAMAHVGLFRALANLEDLAGAEQELQKAQASPSPVSDRERRRIEVTAKHLEALKDLQDAAKHLAYKSAIEDALNANPEDVELWLLRGNAEEVAADGRGQRGRIGSIAFYESALARSNDNFAAHHYLIHSYENIGRNQDAEKHGQRYASLAFGIPHAHHMWGHDLRLVGQIDSAIEQFEIANELEKSWYKNDGIDPSLDWHRPHNLDLLSRSLQYEGRMREAEQHIREAMELTPKTMYAGFRQKMLADFLIARGRNEEALKAAQAMHKSEWSLARVEGHILAGRTLLAMNKVGDARIELDAAEAEVPAAEKAVTGPFSFHRLVDNQLGELRGEVLLRSSDVERAGTLLREVAGSLASHRGADALEELYLLEHIARIAREREQWELAEHASQLMTAFDPSYFGAHYAGGLMAEHNRDAAKARQEMAAAKELWRRADPALAELGAIDSKLLVAAK